MTELRNIVMTELRKLVMTELRNMIMTELPNMIMTELRNMGVNLYLCDAFPIPVLSPGVAGAAYPPHTRESA